MQVTKELLEKEIATMKVRIHDVEASLNNLRGALTVLEDLHRYTEAEEPKAAEQDFISDENKAIQDRDQALVDHYAGDEFEDTFDGNFEGVFG